MRRTFRASKGTQIVSLVALIMVLSLVVAAYADRSDRAKQEAADTLVVFIVLALVAYSVTATGLAAKLTYDERGVEFRNLLFEYRFSWTEISGFSADDCLVVHLADGRAVRVWAVQAANVARVTGRISRADRVVDKLQRAKALPPPEGDKTTESTSGRRPAWPLWWQWLVLAAIISLGVAWLSAI